MQFSRDSSATYAVTRTRRCGCRSRTNEVARSVDAEGVASLDEPTLNSIVLMLFRPGTINLQKYMADEGVPLLALRALPSARSWRDVAPCRSMDHLLERQLSRGETEFLYQRRKIAPRAGSLLIAPTAFTHTHGGNMPKGGDKYIATGWVLFQRAETIHSQRPVAATASRS